MRIINLRWYGNATAVNIGLFSSKSGDHTNSDKGDYLGRINGDDLEKVWVKNTGDTDLQKTYGGVDRYNDVYIHSSIVYQPSKGGKAAPYYAHIMVYRDTEVILDYYVDHIRADLGTTIQLIDSKCPIITYDGVPLPQLYDPSCQNI